MTNIPFGNPGQAASSTEDFTQFDLLLSNTPSFFTMDMILAKSQNIALYQVVGTDGAGHIVSAQDKIVSAIGISAGAITSSATENPAIQIIRGGHFNGDALIWDASYDTDDKKINAFSDIVHPTQIVIGFNKYHRK